MKKSVRASARIAWHNNNVAEKKKTTTQHNKIYKAKLLSKYSHLGTKGRKRNFYIYAREASKIMNESAILGQVSKSWDNLIKEINKQEKKYGLS